ncbi:MAG: outer membrane beta-barrel protein, partial [Ignavibacteriae bacterium]|nr:outer membrane beta-barrel protein [Ignavibacteriota bacterium]
RPEEWISILASAYTGWDTPNTPGRLRFHSDNSLLIRYRNKPGSFIPKAAFSLTGDIGFENGGGVVPFGGDSITPEQNFLSWMFYHRIWLGADEHFAWTFGGGQLHNPGRYLALLPTGTGVLTQNPGDQFDAWDFSMGIQYMPNEHVTWGLEFVHRQASVPYFAGPGGLTSPNGWNPPIGDPTGFKADLVTSENRIIGSLIVRF